MSNPLIFYTDTDLNTLHSKIRIAYIIDRIDAGGTGRQLQLLLEGLDKDRFEPTLFLLKGDTSHPFAPRGVDVELVDVHSLFSLDGLRKIDLLAKRLNEKGCHIVQTFFQDATFFGVLAARKAGVRAVVISIRDLLFWTTRVTFGLYRLVSHLADSVLVNSSAVKRRVESFVRNGKIHVIPNGIPTDDPSLADISSSPLSAEFGFSSGIPLIVLVSNCNRRVKRVDLLIEAIPIVLEHYSAHFMLVGDGYLRPQLESRASELGVFKRITFAGQRHDVERILSEADMALNTSDSEGLSNSVMEAMRAGLPVVASDVEGNRELVTPMGNGLLFKPGDAIDLAAKIGCLIEDEQLRKRLGEAGRQRVEKKFSVQRMVDDHVEFYEVLIRDAE